MGRAMTSKIALNIKHGGKLHPIEVNTERPATEFKQQIYEVTGVPPDRMKVMVKGGILKDDADLSKLGFKAGVPVTVIGVAGELPKAPEKQTQFLEDMDESEIALATRDPPGLFNLGQTCYLNSSLQVMRMMPQIQTALDAYAPPARMQVSSNDSIVSSLKNLYSGMNHTTEPSYPLVLLTALRQAVPQFAEQDSRGNYAQQDADEAWTSIISALRATLSGNAAQGPSIVDKWMGLRLHKVAKCAEAPDEPERVSEEEALKLECNISINTNFLVSGVLDNLDEQIEIRSPSLDRTAVYDQKSRISRMPQYLAVHMVRFYWRRDIQKKAKIMRKVKYPLQLDLSDLITDDLRSKVQPVNNAVREILKDRDDRAKALKRTKPGQKQEGESEEDSRKKEKEKVDALAKEQGLEEVGTNASGMYELCAMVTHKGASADSGHYMGWTRKDGGYVPSGEEEWWHFNDDKVTTVTADKILNMDGGGEDSVAYILLYRAVEM